MANGQPKTSTLAIVALVTGICCGPVGTIVGIIALSQINKSNGTLGGKGLAIAGIVIGASSIFISGILAAIALPNFVRFQNRAKASEARMHLSMLSSQQEVFFAEHDRYVSAGPNGGVGGSVSVPWDGADCPASCGPNDPAACNAFACIGFDPGSTFYTFECTSVEQPQPNFTCAAVADLDDDGDAGVWIIGTGNGANGRLVAPVPGIAARAGCSGANATPDEVVECKPRVY